ncbi:uncharacterized protein [Littorina saxatilis]|uniref:uncharacterized protein isoform X3 n=1 Tax=Littorina saxatilis TaxID=31220 RepID=UPI0038B55C08
MPMVSGSEGGEARVWHHQRWQRWQTRRALFTVLLLLTQQFTITPVLSAGYRRMVDVPLDCQPGWTNIGAKCYRLFQDVLPWESADRVCQSYGARLLKVKDYYENDDVGKFVQRFPSTTEYWIGSTRRGTVVNDERALRWSDGTEATVAVGYWENAQPEPGDGQCVLAKLHNGRVLWSLVPCERKSPYVCQRPAAPAGSFHCHNGHFVRMGLTCDGEDDCGDGSDELACPDRCSYLLTNQQSGTIQSGNYPNGYFNRKTCTWLIELQLGYNVRLRFTEFNTESRSDEVLVLAGGMTVPTSRMVARLSGNLTSLPTYTSSNNFMIVIFSTDDTMSDRGFNAQFFAVKDETLVTRNKLTATSMPKELTSPLYSQSQYLGSQDYTWIITAFEKVKLITLEIVDVDLKGQDSILIRDGDMVFHNLLANLTATSGAMPRYVLSTGRDLYITMQTRGLDTGRGFKFNYWQGCQVNLNSTSGVIQSPGYSATGGQYGAYQTCTYDVTIPGGVPVTVRFDRMKVHETDEVMVYEGNQLLYNLTGQISPPRFTINSGSFRVVFDSDAILTDEGFSITYSVGCSNPPFNPWTIVTPRTTDYKLGTRVDVSCQTGYAFSAVEFQDLNVMDNYEPLKMVTLECMAGGTWNLKTLPLCEPRYCGQAQPVSNAYIVNSTGVTYMATVTYLCYPGFAVQGSQTITCTETGGWTNRPSCQTAACSQLPLTIQNGNQQIKSGSGRDFSSIVEYLCEPGYEIVGSPILFCGSDGRWSAPTPSCGVLQCYVPSIPNGVLDNSGKFIDVRDTVAARCNDGYVSSIPGGGLNIVSCSSDRSLLSLDGFTCTYQDKCLTDPSYCTQICHDSEFENRTCSCNPGYTLGQDMRTCDDINECENNTAGCDQLCNNSQGGYQCGCLPGYTLFSSEGIEGYQLAPNENGMRLGDVRRLNHSCVRVKCPDPQVRSNASLMVKRNSYHFGDVVEYSCKLGFELSGFPLLTCNAQGEWNMSPPSCLAAICLPDQIPSSVRNPAEVTPGGQVGFEETVTLTCNVPGKQVFTRTRHCIYYNGMYKLVGADYECGLIDCGQPQVVSGSSYNGLDTSNTTFGASFQFNCQNLYTVQGQSEQGQDSTVRCLQEGRWDFGSLRCEGLRCDDPGRPPDGQQMNASSYDQGDLVYFSCDKLGFTLDYPYPLMCQLNIAGNGLEWNSTVPSCVDTQNPVLSGCPSDPVAVNRYTRANTLALPTATDNVYVSKYRIIDPVGSDTWPSEEYVLSRMTTFNVTATDHAGNTAHCVTVVGIIDDVPPTIQCPPSVQREFTEENENLNIQFANENLVTVTNDIGIPTFTPSEVQFTPSAAQLNPTFPPFRSYDIMASVLDRSGNMASCKFELMFRPAECSPFTLRTPLHGRKQCTASVNDAGFQCELSCEPGYVFYDEPSDASIVHTCNSGDAWNVPDTPACVQANDTSQNARFRQTFRFTYTKTESGSCSDFTRYRELLQPALVQSEQRLPNVCPLANPNDNFGGELSISDISETGQEVFINVTVTFSVRSVSVYEDCRSVVKSHFEGDNFEVTEPLRTDFKPLGCPGIRYSERGVLVESEYFCESAKKIKYQPVGSSSQIDVCVLCPEGTRVVGSTCELCPMGTFASTPGSGTCTDCGANTSTFKAGAVSNGECTATCKAGMYSATGLPPCMMCPMNTYSSDNSTFCTPCPDEHVTRATGSTNQTQCLPPCPMGTYNPVDGHGNSNAGCIPCPLNFYANKTGMSVCVECAGNDKTEQEMSATAEKCIAHSGCNASNNPCQNNGQCNIVNHAVTCTCSDGYNGQYCEQRVTPCSSNPCYFDATCTSTGNTFTCACPTGTGGLRCENLVASCLPDICENGGVCRNDLNTATCLCRLGFSGGSNSGTDRCQQTTPICQPNPCENNGQCVSLDNIRYRCNCASGFDGQNCQNNIDDCASNPCLHGGTCTDMDNNYQCGCSMGFSGTRCETREPMCATNVCNAGQCVEDHQQSTYRCVCPEGNYYGSVCQYEAYFGFDLNGSAVWIYNASGVSIQDCMARCEAENCSDLLYNTNTNTCRVADPRQAIPISQGGEIFYYRSCTNVEDTYWSAWYDSFMPQSGSGGDDESLASLNGYGLNMCKGTEPVAAQCQRVDTKEPPSQVLAVDCTPTGGLLCFNSDQPNNETCHNYEIRFKCLSSRVLSKSPCQDIDYCSNSSVCQNGGSCSEAMTEASCSCATGYSGSRCQHDEDNCAGNPCQNGATCVDEFNRYRCECMSGYSGVNCDIDVNDCATNPCNSLDRTAQCLDHLNRYQCVCSPGYTGQRCETDINECESQPCRHGGQCINQQNNFTCNCTPGWTGQMCETVEQKCNPATCQNGADCSNLFDDFYCSCKPNTFDKTCSNAPSICFNANPCIHSSNCSERQGIASCDCTPEYAGKGCELLKDVCSSRTPVCMNGATCSSSIEGFSCQCPAGYTGRYCDRNINDCVSNMCPATSTCIDMVNQHFCRCPVGKAGENCDKDVDRRFDLLFWKPQKTSMAALGYPLHLTGDGFTITMWIQFLEKGETGTFFTLYQVRDPNSLADKQELIRLDETGVVLSLDGKPLKLNTTVDYNMDGEWHYIVLSWNKTSGLIAFFVDTVRIPLQNYNTGQPLDLNVWMVLGCNYDVAMDMCREGEGFNGYISQVSLYNRELIFNAELTVLGNTDPFYVFPDAIMTWGEFLLYPGVTRIYPSVADQSCPRGFTGFPTCTTSVAGTTSVEVDHDSCPKDIIQYSTQRVTRITWPDIVFKGQASNVKSSLSSGTVFLWGKYPVIVEASNTDGNKALCTFDIYLQYDQCTTPKTPMNADQVFCANFTDAEKRDYRQCSVSCKADHRVVVPSPAIHTCGPVGSWDPPVPNRYMPYTLPPCGPTSKPKRRLVVVIVYHVPSSECNEVSQEVREQMELRLQQQNARWSNGLCKMTDCSDIQLDISCQVGAAPTGRRKRQATYQDVTVTMTADDVPDMLTNTLDPSLKRSPEDLLQQLVLSDTVFDFSERIAEAVPDPNGLDVKVELLCEAPMALIGDQCVKCAAGSYYNASTETCVLCAIGSYQASSGQTSCSMCSPGLTTETAGSTDNTQCKDVCDPGSFYSQENDACTPCPQGFYQNISGLFYCSPCPVDKTTRQTGAISEDVCFNDCPPGQELTENGTCTPCNIGFYKPSDQTLCEPCPSGLVTNETGAVSRDDCNVADTQAGSYRTRPDETKSALCPIGQYQDQKWQYSCISCGGDRYRTDQQGSTSATDCKFFCPAGEEKVENKDECRSCAVGFYRTGTNPYSDCELCPNNTRTMTTGSDSISDCTLYKCAAGYRPAGQDTCEKCPRGTYQPKADETDCLPCVGNMMDTRMTGSTMMTECEQYCPSGYQKMNGSCIICPIGFYKDNAIDNFYTCTACPDTRYVTPSEGATNVTQCTVLDCAAGYKIQGTVCEACPQGSYQEQPYQPDCMDCPSLQSTRQNTSTSASDCETYCEPGKEKKGDACLGCERGYYKNNMDVFMDCTLCPLQFVTPNRNSTSRTECTVPNCTAGSYINGNGCSMCSFGFYQPDPWQTSCLKCGTDRTTPRFGAVNESECILSCPPGKENKPGSNVCTPCQQGFYKNKEAAVLCDRCPEGYVTRVNNSVESADCNLRACEPGSYASEDSCVACPFGQYQPMKWQEQCLQCSSGFTTYRRGADSQDLCIRDCPPGQEYDNATQTCKPCPVGYYNDDRDPNLYLCTLCDIDFITSGTGTTSADACNIRNCTVMGQYRDMADNVCRDCPRGQWQNQKWQTTCQDCNVGLTTRYTGTSNRSECQYDCPAGQQLGPDNTCNDCIKGTYRNKTDSWECQPCATGLTTPGRGAVSRQECSVSTCGKGNYFNNNAQQQRCEMCPQNSYQDLEGQFNCKPCPDRTQTSQPGADMASKCIDRCQTTANTCDENASCASTTTGVTCVCNSGYIDKDQACQHICDVVGYCQNGAGCDRETKKCICKENYDGDKCELRSDPQKAGLGEKDIIIVAVVTTLAFLLFLILLIVCCCIMARKRQRNKVPFANETSDERASIATRMSTRGYDDFGGGYGTKTPPFNAGPRMMLPAQAQELYENPTYTVSDGDPAVYKV